MGYMGSMGKGYGVPHKTHTSHSKFTFSRKSFGRVSIPLVFDDGSAPAPTVLLAVACRHRPGTKKPCSVTRHCRAPQVPGSSLPGKLVLRVPRAAVKKILQRPSSCCIKAVPVADLTLSAVSTLPNTNFNVLGSGCLCVEGCDFGLFYLGAEVGEGVLVLPGDPSAAFGAPAPVLGRFFPTVRARFCRAT